VSAVTAFEGIASSSLQSTLAVAGRTTESSAAAREVVITVLLPTIAGGGRGWSEVGYTSSLPWSPPASCPWLASSHWSEVVLAGEVAQELELLIKCCGSGTVS
jgi:hypothetical protein